jgi:hypothetical protein
MNKESFLDCYFNELPVSTSVSNLSSVYPEFFTASKQEPENLKPVDSDDSCDISEESSMQETLSFYTALSRLTIDQCMIDDVLANRHKHYPFVQVEKYKKEKYKWYFKTTKGQISGPLTSVHMDDLFRLDMLEMKSKIKNRQDDDYYPLIRLIRRYCKIFKEMNLGMESLPKKVSNKIMKFKKGNTMSKRTSLMSIENYELGVAVRARTKTQASPPALQIKNFGTRKRRNTVRNRAKTRV